MAEALISNFYTREAYRRILEALKRTDMDIFELSICLSSQEMGGSMDSGITTQFIEEPNIIGYSGFFKKSPIYGEPNRFFVIKTETGGKLAVVFRGEIKGNQHYEVRYILYTQPHCELGGEGYGLYIRDNSFYLRYQIFRNGEFYSMVNCNDHRDFILPLKTAVKGEMVGRLFSEKNGLAVGKRLLPLVLIQWGGTLMCALPEEVAEIGRMGCLTVAK